jgi:glutamate/tyrosine decarboxylase-like PLP-dependent enzyme
MTDVRGDVDRLALPAEEMRRIGYATVDALVELATGTPPVLRTATPAEMRERIGGPPPEHGRPYDEVLATMLRDVLPYRSTLWHPGYFAYIPGSTTWPGVMGDLLTSAANLDVGNWMESAGPSQVELEVLGWMRDWIGFPAGSGGILVSGGSAANLTALACARELRLGAMDPRAVAYCSDQSHSSVARAARTLGFRPEQLRVLPTDEKYRMRVDALVAAVDADVAAGRLPLLVAANAGATNTGAVDPLEELAAVCHEQRLWLHVDAAYGGGARLSERDAGRVPDLERADSVTVDPHKWFFQAYDIGGLLVRDGRALAAVFGGRSPEYYRGGEGPGAAGATGPAAAAADAGRDDHADQLNFYKLGFEGTRRWRALKLWMTWKHLGTPGFGRLIEANDDLATYLAARCAEADDFEALPAEPELSVVCFRHRPSGLTGVALDAHQDRLQATLEASGEGWLTTTRLRGATWLRAGIVNYLATEDDIEYLLETLRRQAVEP